MNALALQLRPLLGHPNVRAFLRMIYHGEGTAGPNGHRTMFGGDTFDSFADHPRRAITRKLGGRPITSTAAGAPQFLSRTWDECAAALALPDFSPECQDLGAVFLIRRRRALDDVLAGRIEQAIARCNREWASLPGSPYGQPVTSMAKALQVYREAGGGFGPVDQQEPVHEAPPAPAAPPAATIRPTAHPEQAPFEQAPPVKETTVPSFALAALPTLVKYIPLLGQLFGSGTEVQKRNVATAEAAVQMVVDAVGARNAQEAAEIVATDPTAAATAAKAVEASWFQLQEAGGGGIEGARRFDLALINSEAPWWALMRSPSFIMGILLLGLVYVIVLSLVGVLGSATWSPEVRASLAGAITGAIIGGIVGYYYGQVTSRNRSVAVAPEAPPAHSSP